MKKCYLFLLALTLSLCSLTAQVTDVVTGLNYPYGLVFNGSDLIVSQLTGNVISQFDVNEVPPMLETVLSGVTNPTAMILNGNELIYARGNGNAGIFKIDLTEENPSPVSILENAGLSLITSLLLDGDILYVADRDNGRVYSLDLSQMSPTLTEIASGFNVPTGVVKQGNLLYLLSLGGGSLSTVDLSVSPAVVSTYLTGLNLPVGLVRDGSFLYIAEDDKVSRVDLNQPTPTAQLVTDDVSAPGLVAFNGLDLYITERSAGKIVKLAISTPTFPTQPTICTGSNPTDLGGASPAGGVYSGPNVTDNGDGNTFSFDAATAGAGMHTITYTIDGAMVTGTVTVAESPMVDLGPDLFPPTTSECYQLDGTATGGSGDFSYLWDDGFSVPTLTVCPFADGFISLIVTDNVSGCQAFDTVFYTFTTISLGDIGPFCLDAGVQAGLGSGSPTGGVYSGPGVTDDGNGMTFSFDPSTAGVGAQTITYTAAGGNTATGTIEVLALPTVTFSTGMLEVVEDAGVQTGLGGGMPTGGVYSGNGVTDDGNGMTYSFDPAAAGVGENVITYTYTDANGCSGMQGATITVTSAVLPGDQCEDAIDISNLFGQAAGEPQVSGPYDNSEYSISGTDPTTIDCGFVFLGGSKPIWFSFTGDGNTYNIGTTDASVAFLAVLYSGACGNLTELECIINNSGNNLGYELQTEAGVNYSLLIYNRFDSETGTFNIEVTLQCPEITLTPTLTGVCEDAGVQAGLGGGLPAGGVYSGPGITDDGNGMTFSFDPATAGVGAQTVTYTVTESNIDQEQTNNSDLVGTIAPALYQSFTANADQICGAGLYVSTIAAPGEITIALWDELPNQMGASMLAEASVMITEIGYADVSWSSVSITPGTTYYLRFSEEAVVNADVGGTSVNLYAGGTAYDANYISFPSFDLAFRTFSCSTGSCSGEATAQIEVFGLPEVMFVPSISEVALNAGVQSISGGSPAGGVYSGNGVTDDGNGMTFSFDPAAAGLGENVITYSFTDANGCSGTQGAVITVECPAITLTPTLTGVCEDAGVQAGLGGGLPAGGVYSGPGITDDGNGMTFSFDPATAGVGAQTVTYTVTESNIDQEQSTVTTMNGTAGFGQSGLAQSFIPTNSMMCGAGVLTFDSDGSPVSGDVTITLWDELPITPGAVMLASGTATVTEGEYADVSWPAVSVTPGETYYLVFEGTNTAMFLAGSVTSTYANGQFYANNYNPFPGLDVAFRTFTCSTGACSGEATAQIEVFALPEVTFVPSMDTIALDAGVQSISGGSPAGGVYSGNGVTDDGNGMTFSFDPAAAGLGDNVITYSFTDANGCSGTQGAVVTVTPPIVTCPFEANISLNGGGNEITVLPDEMVDVTGTYTTSNPTDCPTCIQQVVIGLEGDALECVYSDVPTVCPGTTSGDYGFTMTAPTEPGTYNIYANNNFQFTCADALGLYAGADGNNAVLLGTVTVLEVLAGDECPDANDISALFGGDENVPVVSAVQDNTGYDAGNDPGVGYECFAGDPTLNNTIWYAFTGDGNKYSIRSVACGDLNPMTNTDTQFALYTGDCENPTPVACNDDEDFDNQVYNSYLEIVTEPGVNYILMVDGYGSPNDYFAVGEFCLEVTRLAPDNVTNINETELKVYPNPTTGEIQLPQLEMDRLEVYDATGRLVLNLEQPVPSINIANQPAGLYLLKMYAGDDVYSAKVVKE